MPYITISPTQEEYEVPINGGHVNTRIWSGKTDSGVEIEAYIVSIVPMDTESQNSRDMLREWAVNAGMVRSRDKYVIDTAG